MRPLFFFNRWKGINDRVSPRDLPEQSAVVCDNWEIDNVMGNILLSKGWENKLETDFGQNASSFIEGRIFSDSDKKYILIFKSSNVLALLDVGSGTVTNYNLVSIGANLLPSIASNASVVNFSKGHNYFYGGAGSGTTNIPFWLGFIKQSRLWTGAAFLESLNGFYFYTEELLPLKMASGALPFNDQFADVYADNATSEEIATTISGDFLDSRYEFVFTGIDINGQESPVYMDESGKVDYRRKLLIATLASHNTISFDLYYNNTSRTKRLTAINVYMRKVEFRDSTTYWEDNSLRVDVTYRAEKEAWRLVKTVFLNDVKVKERKHDKEAEYYDSDYHIWSGPVTGLSNFYQFSGIQNPANDKIYISYAEYANGLKMSGYLQYPMTPKVMPNYEISTNFKGSRYVSKALYPRINFNALGELERTYNVDDYLPHLVFYSPKDSPNILPVTNYIVFSEAVSALANTDNYLLIFGENSLGIFDEERIYRQDFSESGCVSHRSIVKYNGKVFYAGKKAVYVFNGFYPSDISSFKIREDYNSIPLSSKRESSAEVDLAKNEYILTIPGNKTFIYSLDTGEWRVLTSSLVFIDRGVDQDIIGMYHKDIVGSPPTRKLVTYDSGYSFGGDFYTARYITKVLSGEQAETIIKQLIMGYCSYKSTEQIVITTIIDGVDVQTITLSPQTDWVKPVQFSLVGNAENVQLRIELTTTELTEHGEIDFIKLYGEISDIKGV